MTTDEFTTDELKQLYMHAIREHLRIKHFDWVAYSLTQRYRRDLISRGVLYPELYNLYDQATKTPQGTRTMENQTSS